MKNECFFLMCFLYCPNGALFGAGWEERNKVTLKIGENVTLQFPVNDSAAREIKVQWSKEHHVFLQISKDKQTFLSKNYEFIICSNNISSITICNAARNNTGLYTAQINYRNKSGNPPEKETFYVAEDLNFCDGTTNRNEIEGDTVNLPVKKDPAEHSWWSKNNINVTALENPKLSVYDNGALSILNVRKEDEGDYTVNIVKEISHPYPLCNHTYILSISPSNFCGKTTHRNKIEGDTVNLSVKVCKSAESCWWSKNNITVTAPENPKLSIYDNGTLSINNLTKEDEGNYTVINELTQCNHTYSLSISSADFKNGTSSPLSDNKVGLIVIGVVAAFMIIVLIAVIYRNRKKIQEYCRTRRNHEPVPAEEIQLQGTVQEIKSAAMNNGGSRNIESFGQKRLQNKFQENNKEI